MMTYRELRELINGIPESMLDSGVIGFKKGQLLPYVPFDDVSVVEVKDVFGHKRPVFRLTESK